MSVKLIGEVDWIVQPGYPELSGPKRRRKPQRQGNRHRARTC